MHRLRSRGSVTVSVRAFGLTLGTLGLLAGGLAGAGLTLGYQALRADGLQAARTAALERYDTAGAFLRLPLEPEALPDRELQAEQAGHGRSLPAERQRAEAEPNSGAQQESAGNAVRLVEEIAKLDLPFLGAPPAEAERLVVLLASPDDPEGREAIEGYFSRVAVDPGLSVVLSPVGEGEGAQTVLLGWYAARGRFPEILAGLTAAAAKRPMRVLEEEGGLTPSVIEKHRDSATVLLSSNAAIRKAAGVEETPLQMIYVRGGHVQMPLGQIDDDVFKDRLTRAATPVEEAVALQEKSK